MTRRWRALLSCAIATGLSVGVAAQVIPPPSSQSPPLVKGTGAILGQVLDDGSGQPIAEAVVTLIGRPLAPGALTPPERVLTDARGRFLFHDLSKGPFGISASAPGYSARTPPPPVTLDDGQRIGDFKIRLAKSPVVSGTVFDEAGEPAVGVWVYFTTPGSGSYGASSTDDRGMYRRVECQADCWSPCRKIE